MSELELALSRIGGELDYPETPDLAGQMRRRLAEGRRPRSWRRPLAVALAVLVVAAGAVLAIPPARSAILDWLGIGSVTIHRVDELPRIERTDLFLGRRMSLPEARRAASFLVRVPTLDELGRPTAYFRRDVNQVSLLYGSEQEPKLLISELWAPGALDKFVTTQTDVEPVREGDWHGAWLEGGEHALYLPGFDRELRLVGNTLVVAGPDDVTVRIEADISKGEALRILRAMR